MRTRFIIGPILIVVVLGIFLADHLFMPKTRPLGVCLIAALAGLGWLEFARLFAGGRLWAPGSRALTVAGGAVVLFFHFAAFREGAPGLFSESAARWSFDAASAPALLVAVVAFAALVVPRKDYAQHYQRFLESIFGVLVLGWLFSYHVRLYLDADGGPILAMVYFAGVKGVDVAAYLVGSKLGRHRFLAVSPKKTLEGCIGGALWGAAWFGALSYFRDPWLFPWPQGIAFGIILAVVSQLGDLSESLFKRMHGAKDSGFLLPEFGGVLDLIDSLLLTGALFWFLVNGCT
jgi:phosphatidate cytidylyltransferase